MDTRAATHEVVRRVPARVGLVGNPSDGFDGAVLATIVPGLEAIVRVAASDGVVVAGPAATERWPSLRAWRAEVAGRGVVGPHRIIAASLWSLVEHVRRTDPHVVDRSGMEISWRTDIPMSVGLAGSSALAVGTIDAVAVSWGIDLDRRVCAALALSAERDVLGIAAGWQDRIVQASGRTVLVDAGRMEPVDGVAVPAVREVARPVVGEPFVHLLVGWQPASGASSDDYHAPIRRDAQALAAPMAALGRLARSAAEHLEHAEFGALAAAVDAGWAIRQSCVPLRADHAAIVESVRTTGVAATTPGSGGSVVAVCLDPEAVVRARGALDACGCSSIEVGID